MRRLAGLLTAARRRRWPRWLAPAIGVGALVLVQAGVISSAGLMALTGDEFLRYEEVTVVADLPGYPPRWRVERENGDSLNMPPPDGMDFEADRRMCVRLDTGRLGNVKARLADSGSCAATRG